MKNPNGPYPGRQLFLGITVDKKPAFAYLVTGRSAASRERLATPLDNSIIMGPLENAPYDWLRHYIATKVDNTIGLAAVSNGIQTEATFEMYKLLYYCGQTPDESYIRKIMDGANYEPDSISTPRIAGVIMNIPEKIEPVYYASIIAKGRPAAAWQIKPEAGTFYGVSTYQGDIEKPAAFDINGGLSTLESSAETAQQIAEFIYKISEAEYKGDDIRVCAIGGVRHGNAWDTAVVNRHKG